MKGVALVTEGKMKSACEALALLPGEAGQLEASSCVQCNLNFVKIGNQGKRG
jgi:hypothetical protein